MLPSDGRAGNICIWLITCIFFVSILVGGCLLILYIALPASDTTFWFLVSGTVLIAIPWVSWFFICVYRCVTLRLSRAQVDRPPTFRAASVAPIRGLSSSSSPRGGVDSPVSSPGARRVRFVDSQEGQAGDKGSPSGAS